VVSQSTFDLIIIGAGVNGAGIARDAAMRKLKVCLIDKDDIGSGTSSWSTRLIHGGLRYLEHAEFGLVRESLRERETLLRIAPHLVRPLPLLIPIYKDSKRGPLQIRAGMLLYDWLSRGSRLPRHRMLSRRQSLELIPGLNAAGLRSSALYYDAQVEFAERLVLENVLSARENGAVIHTHARVTRLISEGRRATGVEFVSDGENQVVRGEFVVNAAGPWVDSLLRSTKRLIGGTKGSHVIVSPFAGAPEVAIYSEAQADHRPFFIIPWNGNYLIGTTDTRFNGDLDDIRIDTSEVEYLLSETNRVFPRSALKKSDILFTYSGVRPLPFVDNVQERKITRRHSIHFDEQLENLCSVVGGKLTTYRNLAEECVDLIAGRVRTTTPRSATTTTPLPGARNFTEFSAEFLSTAELPQSVLQRLLRVYGVRAADVVQFCRQSPELLGELDSSSNILAGEIVFAFECELAQTLTDCLLRRSMAGLNPGLAIGLDEKAAAVAMKFLGWSSDRANHEVQEYRRYIERMQTSALPSHE